MKLLCIVGSLSLRSYNKSLINAVGAVLHGKGIDFSIAEIGGLPHFNSDIEGHFPQEVLVLKDMIRAADGVFIATPEFNRSIPGVLKNAFDWTSRGEGGAVWSEKAVYVMGASTGLVATALAQYHLKQILLYLNARVLGQPEIQIALAEKKFDKEGLLIDEATKKFLTSAIDAFLSFIQRKL